MAVPREQGSGDPILSHSSLAKCMADG